MRYDGAFWGQIFDERMNFVNTTSSMAIEVGDRVNLFARDIGRDVRGQNTPLLADEHHLTAAIDWLYKSQDVTENGGSAFGYHLLRGWKIPYPETSGYIIPTLYNHADSTSKSEPRERANRMAEWLLMLQNEDGSFPGYNDSVVGGGSPTVFDTGQILLGLLCAFEETNDGRYQEAIASACEWLVDSQDPEGYWAKHAYKGRRHTYCVRVAWPLLQAAETLDEDRYADAAIANLEWTETRQCSNGWFEECAFSSSENPYLHTIAYTVRGLLECGLRLPEETFLETARTTADRLISIQNRHGVLKGEYGPKWEPASYYCLTGNAQMAVIWYRLYQHSGEEKYRIAARRTLEFLKGKQRVRAHSSIRGAIAGSYPVWGRYLRLQYPNWATKFFADVLHLAAAVKSP